MAGHTVGPDADAAELARVAAALGIQPAPRKAPAKKAAKKAVKKAQPAKKAAPRKAAAKKAPAKRVPGKKAAARAAAAADPTVPDELAVASGEAVVAEPAEIVPALHELEDPARDAHDMWVQGIPWEEIALRTGYASSESASAAVAIWLQRGAIHDGVQAARARAAQALAVTERIKSAFFDRAMQGDKDAAQVVLAANRDFYKMAGLEAGALTINSKRTLIISDNPGQGGMAAELRAAALANEEARHAVTEETITSTEDEVR